MNTENSNENKEQQPYSSENREQRPHNNENREQRPYNNENRERRPYNNENREQRPYNNENRERRPYNPDYRRDGNNSYQKRSFNNNNGGGYAPRRNYENRQQQRDLPDNYGNRWNNDGNDNRPQRSWNNRNSDNRPQQQRSWNSNNYQGNNNRPQRSWNNSNNNRNFDRNSDYPPRRQWNSEGGDDNRNFVETRFDNRRDGNVKFRKRKTNNAESHYTVQPKPEYKQEYFDPTVPVRLNKFLANTGICSRREADEYIQAGVINVNGVVVSALGTKILPTDTVKFHDQLVQSERKIYILLNKPKDCVTTTEDPNAKKNVMDIVHNACSERIYPVGRLDRNTTGVLLLTNDGDLASKLAHPKFEKKKVYQVVLDKPLIAADFRTIMLGVELEDGEIAADALEYASIEKKDTIGIEIHSGKNRIVRRIFEKLGYKVKRLDRVMFAGLTKKNLPRGKYRFLSEKEVAFLKMGNF
ncbi:MAG: pseudouridine synthase [Prevotellaceae bacterium]|jgi:23S rRNA pseudouridine2605 synthase|nr:pseudouridine synthase [Prevotellaceae bacterium]